MRDSVWRQVTYLLVGILAAGQYPSLAQTVDLPQKINIYCTNNLDGTGQCYEVNTNTLLKCTGVPGEIIPCRIPGGATYNCIFFAQSLLACDRKLSSSIEQRSDKILNKSVFMNDLDGDGVIDPDEDESNKSGKPSPALDERKNQKPNEKSMPDGEKSVPIILPTW